MAVLANYEATGWLGTSPSERAVGEHNFDAELLGVVLWMPIGEHLVERVLGSLLFVDDAWIGVCSGIASVDGT